MVLVPTGEFIMGSDKKTDRLAYRGETPQRTLLRTVPEVGQDGTFLSFQPHQIYHKAQGFGVNRHDA